MNIPVTISRQRRKFPFLYGAPDIPVDKAKIVAKLDVMKLEGWKDLEDMTIEELNELQAEAEGAIIDINEYGFTGFDNPHDRTIIEAREAIKQQRRKTLDKQYEERARQDDRLHAFMTAANFIKRAIDSLEEAHQIEPNPTFYAAHMPEYDYEIDPSAMSDGELNYFVRKYDPHIFGNPFPDHAVFAYLKTPEAKAAAAEFKEYNEAFQERMEIMRANYAAAREELSERNRAAQEKAIERAEKRNQLDMKDKNDVLADLMNRIEELEASK